MNIDFTGKRALVTGAGKGIGRGIAKALVVGGAKTYAVSRTQEDLDTLKAEHPSIHTVCVDLAQWEAARKSIEDVGPIDLLVNNAGIAIFKDFCQLSAEDFDKTFDTNIKAVFNVSQIIAKGMVERGKGGAIVNISSICSRVALHGTAVYSATKGALDSMTSVMALELGPHQIRTNCVNPTVVKTGMADRAWPPGADRTNKMLERTPQGKFAEVKEVVNAVLYLLSDNADMINGAFLPVDGGVWIS